MILSALRAYGRFVSDGGMNYPGEGDFTIRLFQLCYWLFPFAVFACLVLEVISTVQKNRDKK
jgi:hypothetical protein